MPLYDMHCSRKECSYTGEHLLLNRDETLQCPKCEEGELVKNIVQRFNVIEGKGSRGNPNDEFYVKEASLANVICSCGYVGKLPVIEVGRKRSVATSKN